MKIYDNSIVYILSPGNRHTGGIELLHQLASQLTALGITAKMVYFEQSQPDPVDPAYTKYHLDYTNDLQDDDTNIVICPETVTSFIMDFRFAKKIIWWLSVDNYLLTFRNYLEDIKDEYHAAYKLLKIFYFSGQYTGLEHWYQSEYARQFLLLNDVPEELIIPMEDYLSQGFLHDLPQTRSPRTPRSVAFNPIKGFETTKALMKKHPNINWFPIVNMTAAEVRETLLHTQIYIDFGHHPGKDRIPREAALSGCVIITGKRGAAANDIDINIPERFKCEDNDYDNILRTMEDIFTDFGTAYAEQAPYRMRILDDFPRFQREIINAFAITTNKLPLWSAVINDSDNSGITIVQALSDTPCEYKITFLIDDQLAKSQTPSPHFHIEKNRRYLTLDNQEKIEVITAADADFLYLEGRINKFFRRNINDNKQDILCQQLLHLDKKDLLTV